jgi:hypothetical protein
MVSHTTVAKWWKAEHLEDKSSRLKTIHYALSQAEAKIIKIVRKRGLFSLDDLYLSLALYLKNLNRTNCYRTLVRYRLNKFNNQEKIGKEICQLFAWFSSSGRLLLTQD